MPTSINDKIIERKSELKSHPTSLTVNSKMDSSDCRNRRFSNAVDEEYNEDLNSVTAQARKSQKDHS